MWGPFRKPSGAATSHMFPTRIKFPPIPPVGCMPERGISVCKCVPQPRHNSDGGDRNQEEGSSRPSHLGAHAYVPDPSTSRALRFRVRRESTFIHRVSAEAIAGKWRQPSLSPRRPRDASKSDRTLSLREAGCG